MGLDTAICYWKTKKMNWACLYRENQLYYCIYDCRFVGQITKPHMQQISFHSRSIFFLSINSLTAMIFFSIISVHCIQYEYIQSDMNSYRKQVYIFFFICPCCLLWYRFSSVRFGSIYCIAIHIQFYTHIVDKMSQMRQRKKNMSNLQQKQYNALGALPLVLPTKCVIY